MNNKETLVEKIEKEYKIKLRAKRDCTLEELLYTYGLSGMKNKLKE